MRYRPAQYAEALHGALEGKPVAKRKDIIRRFIAMVARHRMSNKIGLIVSAYEKLVLHEGGMRKVRIESAAPVSAQLKKEISEILGKKIVLEEKTRPDLLAGIKILVDDELLIDATGKRQLERIFHT